MLWASVYGDWGGFEMAKKQTIGKNISWTQSGDILTLEIDVSKEFGPSNSGKTIIVASSEGNKTVGDVRFGLNVYKYPAGGKVKKKK
jgi:hypothetical protein